ncbi:hypothetical protein H4217_008207 [Coemansia sp. RSA 1939]|nr:hypothetical protein H4217_008207 [Coemansia sp. RSA 1939]KAJ2611234.1 hypothetical protein EV177_003587 [Coemansia sp. RSA 1804]
MSTGGGTDLTEEQRQHGRQSGQSTPMYWCHQCQNEISPMMAPNPICPRCHGDFVEEIEAENDPRDFLTGGDAGNGNDEDEMENEFGGAGNYNQELQTMIQDMLSNIMGRQIPTTEGEQGQTGDQRQQPSSSTDGGAAGNNNNNSSIPGSMPNSSSAGRSGTFGRATNASSGTADSGERQFPGMRTWSSNVGGTHVSFSVGGFSPEAFANRAPATASGGGGTQRRTGNDSGVSADQQRDSGDDGRRPMFIDPEENAPLTLGNLVSSLLGALGGASRGEDGQGPGGMSQLFGVPIGNLGDYAWGQNSLDDIITNLMDQNPGANSQPPASDESISKLPRRRVTAEEVDRKLDCGICMDEYNKDEEVVELPCKHIYHKDCIEHWLKMNGTCPVCRTRIDLNDSKDGADVGTEDGGSSVPRAHSNLPGAFPSSSDGSTAPQPQSRQQQQQQQQHGAESGTTVPEQEPVD